VVYGTGSTFQVTATGTAPITYSLTGAVPAGVSINSVMGLITIAGNTATGSHIFTITASNDVSPNATQTFTLTVTAANTAPTIDGLTTMSLTVGYAATSTSEYTITGNPSPTVSKTSGNAAILWNNATRKLDIAAGLTVGNYPVVLTASNGVSPDATITFTLTVNDDEAPFVPVAAITGVPTRATAGTLLTLTGTVAPSNATNKTIVWSVKSAGGTGAAITGNTFKATAAGVATITATVANGAAENTDYTQDFNITVENVTGVTEIPVTNPLKAWIRNGLLHVTGLTAGETLCIYNTSGALLYQNIATSDEMDVFLGVQGVYIVRQGENTVKVSFN
jgi:hypothetical protein